MKDYNWDTFMNSGRVNDYLKYRMEQQNTAAKNSVAERENENESDSHCDRHGFECNAYR